MHRTYMDQIKRRVMTSELSKMVNSDHEYWKTKNIVRKIRNPSFKTVLWENQMFNLLRVFESL